MSNSILPHLLSDSPPPLEADDEDFEDEYGDFKGPEELSFDNEILPLPSSLNNSKNNLHDLSNSNKYEIFNNESKTTINSVPSLNYFSAWDQIEKDVPEFIDNEENGEYYKSAENFENEQTKKFTTVLKSSVDQSVENLCKSCDAVNVQQLNDDISLDHVEYTFEITQQGNHIDSPNLVEENETFHSITPDKNSEELENGLICTDSSLEHSKVSIEEDNISEVRNEDDIDEYPSYSLGNNNYVEFNNDQLSNIAFSPKEQNYHSEEESISQENELGSLNNSLQESQEEDDEFADFSSFSLKSDNVSVGIVKEPTEITQNEFESYQNAVPAIIGDSAESTTVSQENIKQLDDETQDFDEFDDFACYSAPVPEKSEDIVANECEEANFKICETSEEASKEMQIILGKMFPVVECESSNYSNCDYIMDNTVFENLKDITETNALTYQWEKSVAQKTILKTLNIDVRNILYGPTWNSGVPIFAANLCAKPLEPIKSDLPIPTSPQINIEPQESTPPIPQFDWAGSGLSNLQDSLENEEVKNIRELDNIENKTLKPSTTLQNEGDELEDKSSQFEVINHEDLDDFSDFASYQEEEDVKRFSNILPLRESHISCETKEDTETDKISKYFQDLAMGKIETYTIDKSKVDPKFGFKSLNHDHFMVKSPSVFNECGLEINENRTNPVKNDERLEKNKPNNCDILPNSSFKFPEETNDLNEIKPFESNLQEDEFTDFQCSLPSVKQEIAPVLLEPLQPSVLQPKATKHQPLKIEWPAPGLDEDEINRIVNGVFRKNSTNESVVEQSVSVKTTESTGKNDPDDWSEFMSVKEPLKKRTSTPDLPLSVFNLGSIQPNRVIAPYVAPNGVVHSPSKTSSLSFPVINRNVQGNSQQQVHQQPFITSQAFNALYSNSKNNILLPNTPIGMSNKIKPNFNNTVCSNSNREVNGKVTQNRPNAEEDDWGDFVSAPRSVSQFNSTANFLEPSTYMKTTFGFSGRSGPVQLSPTTNKNTVVRQEKNSHPIISTMPDLDFVSPKSRSTIK